MPCPLHPARGSHSSSRVGTSRPTWSSGYRPDRPAVTGLDRHALVKTTANQTRLDGGQMNDGDGIGIRRPTVVEELEEDLAIWTGGISCVAVSSASAALHAAYAATGLRSGDEVIVPAMSF